MGWNESNEMREKVNVIVAAFHKQNLQYCREHLPTIWQAYFEGQEIAEDDEDALGTVHSLMLQVGLPEEAKVVEDAIANLVDQKDMKIRGELNAAISAFNQNDHDDTREIVLHLWQDHFMGRTIPEKDIDIVEILQSMMAQCGLVDHAAAVSDALLKWKSERRVLNLRRFRSWAFENAKRNVFPEGYVDIHKNFSTEYTVIDGPTEHIANLELQNTDPFLACFSNVTLGPRLRCIYTDTAEVVYSGMDCDAERFIYGDTNAIGKVSSKGQVIVRARKPDVEVDGESMLVTFGSKFFGFNMMYTVAIANSLVDCPTKDISLYVSGEWPISPFFLEIFSRIGIDVDRLNVVDLNTIHRFHDLWVPENPISCGTGPHTTSTMFFERFRRKLGLPDTLPTGHKNRNRVYVSRADAPWRKIVNEEELSAALEKFGFITINAASYPLQDLLDILGNTEIMLTSVGSNFSNNVFAPQGAQIGEFMPRHHGLDAAYENAGNTY